jgi:hypothetical protein
MPQNTEASLKHLSQIMKGEKEPISFETSSYNEGASFEGQVIGGNLSILYLNSFIIPPLLTSISDGTFYASTLPSVSIPNSVVSIGKGAFTSCYKLTSVTGMNSVNSIGEAAFGGCTILTSFQIPSSVTSISNQLLLQFLELEGLKKVEI